MIRFHKTGFLSLHWSVIIPLFALSIFACHKTSTGNLVSGGPYSIMGKNILKNNQPVQLIGANAFHVFGAGSRDMNAWNLDIAREFIGNVKETPLSGGVIKDANGSWLYSLQTVADSNRINNRITIFCAFGWDGTTGTLFTGQNPSQTAWWSDFKLKLTQWATQFKNQPDTWLEVWNEPYRYDGSGGYSDNLWLSDMSALVAIVRNTGNQNILLVPCAGQGQDESVLLAQGNNLLNNQQNLLFDIHAYEKWLLVPVNTMGSRLQQLQTAKLPVIFGETAPMNAGTLMNPAALLDSTYKHGLSSCAWVWKNDSTDTDALLTNTGLPNNNNNNIWGSLFYQFSTQTRNPLP